MKLFNINKGSMLRSIVYVILSIGSIAWLFAKYWDHDSAITTTIIVGIIFAILSLVAQRIAQKCEGGLCIIALALMTILPAIMVPATWYLGGFGDYAGDTSYLEDCKLTMLTCVLFGVVALESVFIGNQNSANVKIPPHRIVIIWIICVFGFTGLKQLCKFVANFSGENFLCSMLFIALATVAPILIIMSIFAYFLWEKDIDI